jgi:excisionase family DNA binding protein
MTDTYMTREEAAEYLKVSAATLDRYVRQGKLRRLRLAGTRTARFKKGDLDALVEPDQPSELCRCG